MGDAIGAIFLIGLAAVLSGIGYMLLESAWDDWNYDDRPVAVIKVGVVFVILALIGLVIWGCMAAGTAVSE
jgi:hypothetical protein